MLPNKEHLLRWARETCHMYERIPQSKVLLFASYMDDLNAQDWCWLIDRIPAPLLHRLRKFNKAKALEEMYGN